VSPAGYSGTPLWKKLGVKPGMTITLLGAPRGWSVPDLPQGAGARRESMGAAGESTLELAVAFFRERSALEAAIAGLVRRIFPAGALWVAWPRRAAGHESDIRDTGVRALALPLGVVDVKVAALDEDWSGLRLLWRRELRGASCSRPG
jgi:hypothetical protein